MHAIHHLNSCYLLPAFYMAPTVVGAKNNSFALTEDLFLDYEYTCLDSLITFVLSNDNMASHHRDTAVNEGALLPEHSSLILTGKTHTEQSCLRETFRSTHSALAPSTFLFGKCRT